MRIGIISDVHLEMYRKKGVPFPELVDRDYDVLVCAGDLDNSTDGIKWLSKQHHEIIYVLGNHERYGAEIRSRDEEFRNCCSELKNVHLLEGNSVIIEGINFVGDTLWTDFNLISEKKSAMMEYARSNIADYRVISITDSDGERKLHPEDTIAMFNEAAESIKNNLSDKLPNIVVTHHLPHRSSIDQKFLTSPLNPAFASDLLCDSEHGRVSVWIHGHTHCRVNYNIGSTQVLCNPHGYLGYEHQSNHLIPMIYDLE